MSQTMICPEGPGCAYAHECHHSHPHEDEYPCRLGSCYAYRNDDAPVCVEYNPDWAIKTLLRVEDTTYPFTIREET